MINTEGLRKTTRLTVCNYDNYQSEQQANNKETTSSQHTANTQLTTNKNVKKEKNTIIPTIEDFVAYGLSLVADVSTEALRLKYESWLVNDWCTSKDGKPKKILNWKSTLSNTIPYLPKQPKEVGKSEEQIRYEHVMKQFNLNK